MKLTSFRNFTAIVALFAGTSVFYSCEKEDNKPSGPEDKTIVISDIESFNMKNFQASFEQLFVASERWAWDFDHDYSDGKITKSYQNNKVYGSFGDKIFSIEHQYDAKGIIIKSIRNSSTFEDDTVSFTYKFNTEGYIVELSKWNKNKLRDKVSLEYNEKMQLIKKVHEIIPERNISIWTEAYTYNEQGQVASYLSEGEKEVYTYDKGNMIKAEEYEDEVLEDVDNYEYNSNGWITKLYDENDDSWYEVYEYGELLVITQYEYGLVDEKIEMTKGFIEVREWEYSYDENNAFEYAVLWEGDENGDTKEVAYLTGSINSLQKIGYSVVDERDPSKDNVIIQESYYDVSSNTRLYYVIYTYTYKSEYDEWWQTGTQWYKNDGTPIDMSEITEEWVQNIY